MTNQNEATKHKAVQECGGPVDPLVMRGIKLSGDCFADCNLLVDAIVRDTNALKAIAAIEDKLDGGDWDEIEQARQIANDALGA